ncbi:NUMOD4 domain-containing protein [Mycobacterium avium]|uniref:NUMOD4 domain-containing protein n=1 Tax=Mycobacterium avium TaxID=1764 RepID=UPI001CC4B4C0|nr:NUMOD4 domain-containing protein [Mycobacterium avium]MBZ4580994.1 hypothetical protein [Mycobacterium avium subsp. hominissuis]MBZ4608917.1 hypothetical protein [Mycobacterium avium subsp. hominissuis]
MSPPEYLPLAPQPDGHGGEVFRDIEGWAEYQISNRRRVKSKRRIVIRSDGRRHTVRQRILRPVLIEGCETVTLTRLGRREQEHRTIAALMSEVWPEIQTPRKDLAP